MDYSPNALKQATLRIAKRYIMDRFADKCEADFYGSLAALTEKELRFLFEKLFRYEHEFPNKEYLSICVNDLVYKRFSPKSAPLADGFDDMVGRMLRSVDTHKRKVRITYDPNDIKGNIWLSEEMRPAFAVIDEEIESSGRKDASDAATAIVYWALRGRTLDDAAGAVSIESGEPEALLYAELPDELLGVATDVASHALDSARWNVKWAIAGDKKINPYNHPVVTLESILRSGLVPIGLTEEEFLIWKPPVRPKVKDDHLF